MFPGFAMCLSNFLPWPYLGYTKVNRIVCGIFITIRCDIDRIAVYVIYRNGIISATLWKKNTKTKKTALCFLANSCYSLIWIRSNRSEYMYRNWTTQCQFPPTSIYMGNVIKITRLVEIDPEKKQQNNKNNSNNINKCKNDAW